jgi:hypothetical protein
VARAEVHVSIRNGRVSIMAKDATVRQILVEWARVGKTRIVNVERVPGGPLTLELKDVSEAEALDVLLRSLSGYMAAPRLTMASADVSAYDSIVVMPTTAATATRTAGPSNAPAPFAPPTGDLSQDDSDTLQRGLDNVNAPARPGGGQPARAPIFTTFPQPQVGGGNPNGNGGGRPMLPIVRPGGVQQGAQNNGNDGGQAPLALPPAAATPSPSPGQRPGSGAVSAPGMIAPSPASQPGQIAPQQ